MISKIQLNKIVFIKKNIIEKELFISELFNKLDLFLNNEISNKEFDSWLDSWEAAAELDQDPKVSKRIKRALEEIKSKKTPHKNWKEFKDSLGLS